MFLFGKHLRQDSCAQVLDLIFCAEGLWLVTLNCRFFILMKSPFTNQSFAESLSLHAEQVSDKSSDDDATDHAVVDFVDSMVQAIVINRASGTSLALPAVVRTINTSTRRPTNQPTKKKRKHGSGAMIWTNPCFGL
jgi:hypothetical protein